MFYIRNIEVVDARVWRVLSSSEGRVRYIIRIRYDRNDNFRLCQISKRKDSHWASAGNDRLFSIGSHGNLFYQQFFYLPSEQVQGTYSR